MNFDVVHVGIVEVALVCALNVAGTLPLTSGGDVTPSILNSHRNNDVESTVVDEVVRVSEGRADNITGSTEGMADAKTVDNVITSDEALTAMDVGQHVVNHRHNVHLIPSAGVSVSEVRCVDPVVPVVVITIRETVP